MAGGGQPPRSDKPSIKYRFNPLEGASFELADFDHEDYVPTSAHNNQQNIRRYEPKSSEILSTAELISAVGRIRDSACRPLSIFRPKTSSRQNNGDLPRGKMFSYPAGEGNRGVHSSADGQYLSIDLMNNSHAPPMVQGDLNCLNVIQKMSFFEPYSGSYTYSFFWRFIQGSSNKPNESWKEKGLASVGISHDLGSIYTWINELTLAGLKHHVNLRQIKNKKTDECCTGEGASCCASGDTTSLANNMIVGSADCHTEITKPLDLLTGQIEKSMINTRASITSLYSDFYLEPVQDIEANGTIARTPSSHLPAGSHLNVLASNSCAYEESQHKTKEEDYLCEKQKNQQKEFLIVDQSEVNICSSTLNKPQYAFAKQEHAIAGAMAGILVSLCLHPVDTIKTVIQSCRTDQKSIHYISRSIISQRGVTGLYRGITSNIASSAPISAVYTFTYESVKGTLLPLFPKEYQSLAHCMAGGCASLATSFIFTPSERIKQQMQVGSHYQNCWNALIRIIEKGGLRSLYAGWGAVLCRNVPHSIIKFYTYESLKQVMLPSLLLNAQPNTLPTLVCGGLAGSTAALFTTPFDVVKTRLQTQIPGSINQYEGVFNTLIGIGKHEGLKGLYRGLTPRLVMYMTQGALFFASYESFKRLFSLGLPQLNAQTIQHEQKVEDD